MTEKVSYEEVQKLKDDKNVLIIDVREPSEIEKSGSIPGSINIPLPKLIDELKTCTTNDFKSLYGREKPGNDLPLVFSCQAGGRAARARNMALELGYKNVRYYPGSWAEWESKMKQ